ncbi:MAG: ImmA/IrrE family metallo-endopeptidase [Actinomycetota bacterium]|nr:ImmA/IrrE family metallo-endopeptidase [Actinomycetota bacterium]
MAGALTVGDCVARLLAAVAQHREALARDTLPTIRSVLGVPVTERPEHRRDGVCAVDGAYFHDPPRIVVAASESLRRRAFTALHELAHHLLRGDFDFFFLAGDRPLEEEVCDRFAAEILLPTALAERLLSVPVPTAEDFADLYDNSHASRALCARRVADALPRMGHAVVALRTVVTYCASAHTLFRARYPTEQGEQSIFAEAVRHGGAAGMARLLYQENVVSPLFRAEAVFHEDHVFAVFIDPEETG